MRRSFESVGALPARIGVLFAGSVEDEKDEKDGKGGTLCRVGL